MFGTTYISLSKKFIQTDAWDEKSKRIMVEPFIKLLCHISAYDEPFVCLYILIWMMYYVFTY